MRFLSLSVIHARMAARQRAIRVASLLLALLSMGVAVNTGLPFETGDVADLVFLAQMLAMLPPVAYAAAFTDLAAEPERLGISEVEASAPVRPMELTVARVVGALAVMTSPSAALLLFCAAGLGGAFCAAGACVAPEAVPAGALAEEPYVAQSEDGRLIVSRGGETVLRTAIDVRTLPAADREALADGVVLADAEALARLLEDYGS